MQVCVNGSSSLPKYTGDVTVATVEGLRAVGALLSHGDVVTFGAHPVPMRCVWLCVAVCDCVYMCVHVCKWLCVHVCKPGVCLCEPGVVCGAHSQPIPAPWHVSTNASDCL